MTEILRMLQIYNSLTRRKEDFVPIEPGRVRLYVCGMTVYDYCHVGHARAMVVFDVVVRYLRARGFDVTYVRNITDIDDKIIRRARENGEEVRGLTERFIQAMHEDAEALGVLPPSVEPRATASMDAIRAMVQTLLEKGYAYQAGNGDVYYDVSRFERYGRLANQRLEDLRAGSRVEVGEAKCDPLDFVLWKAAKPSEPSWDSPWGPGRPGWHIECSAMATSCLGEHFDIHGGGMDLKFPHHECEIAQSEAATGHKFVNYWMHNGFVQINEEKMSKSLGNFFTVREVLKLYRPEVVRFFILSSHYRGPLNYSDENLDNAKASLDQFYLALRGLSKKLVAPVDEFWQERFNAAMDDDFNTPEALAVLHDLRKEINDRKQKKDIDEAGRLGAILRQLGVTLGLLQDDPDRFLQGGLTSVASQHVAAYDTGISGNKIEEMISRRDIARKSKNWAEADRIREHLASEGIILEDTPAGTVWRRD